MDFKSVVGFLEFVVVFGIITPPSNNNCDCDNNCTLISNDQIMQPAKVLVLYDQCEFDCIQKLYANLTKTTCPDGTISPGRSYPKTLYERDYKCMCNCMNIYSDIGVVPKPICATYSFTECQYKCVKGRYTGQYGGLDE